MPSGGGTVVIDAPAQAIIFFGTNFTAVDTIVTSTGTGIFFGMAAPNADNPGIIDQHGIGIVPDGDAWCADNLAIIAPHPDGSGATLFKAEVTSLGDTVTLNFTQGASGGYRVYYLAIDEFDHAVAFGAGTSGLTKSLGWKAYTAVQGSVIGSSLGVGSDNNYHGATWGGGSYFPDNDLSWTWGWLSAYSFPTSISGQGLSDIGAGSGSDGRIGLGTHFTGPFLTPGAVTGKPVGVDRHDFFYSPDVANYGHVLVWDGVSQFKIFSIPGSTPGDQAITTFTQLEAVEAILTFTLSNAPQGLNNNAGGAAGFCVATEDFQACALVDAMDSRGAYQSNTKGWISFVDASSVRAGTVTFDSNDVILETVDGGSIAGTLVGLGFVDVDPNPGFFRLV